MLFCGHSEAILDSHLHRREAPHEHIEIVPLKPADTIIALFKNFPETTLRQSFDILKNPSPSHFNAFIVLRSFEKNTYTSPDAGECPFHDHTICVRPRMP